MLNCPVCSAAVPPKQAFLSPRWSPFICVCGAKLWLKTPSRLSFLFMIASIILLTAIKPLQLLPWMYWAIVALLLAGLVALNYFDMLRRGRMVLMPDLPVI
jgi:hypothetical protein